MRRMISVLLFLFLTIISLTINVYACNSCGSTVCLLGKGDDVARESSNQKWYFKYLYDQVVWHDKSAESVNAQINDGHDVHNKTVEATSHFQLGRRVTDDLNIFVDLPYVVRTAIESEDIDHLGDKQRSKGFGDVQLLGNYRFWRNTDNAASLAGGLKFPTGSTHQKSFQGDRFETDMQPGSGALNYIVGGIYNYQKGRFSATANSSYVFTTKGAQGFIFGDLFSATVYGDYLLNPNSTCLKTHVGLDTVFQNEMKERTNGAKNPDSGGQSVLLGPVFRIEAVNDVSIIGTFLYPISQKLNGLTQEQVFEWTMSAQIKF